jgi:alpha-ketoglutarate-dependent taurine dioxygenase
MQGSALTRRSEEGKAMSTLQVRELMPGFGAEVSGLEPAYELDDATCRELQALLRDRELLVFRNFEIDRRFQTYLCELLRTEGPPDPVMVDENAARQESFYISNKLENAAAPFGELMFHSDAMWSTVPYDVLSLWGEKVEPPVTPTRFSSVTRAWETLPDDLRERAEGKLVEQTNQIQVRGDNEGRLLLTQREERTTITPLGHRNPRSGRTMLYACSMMTSKVLDVSPEESEDLLNALFEHIAEPSGVWQHEWQPNDLVIWDNLAIQHARGDVEVEGPVRTLRKSAAPVVPAGVAASQTYTMG